jgi:uncharacterized protein (TIGR03084 family)
VTELHEVISDLAAQGEQVDRLVAGLDASDWGRSTPAPGWTFAHQIAHLASVFALAALAASDPQGFGNLAAGLSDDFDANVAAALAGYLAAPPDVLLERWRAERSKAEHALAAVPPGQVVPWLVRPLPPGVLACAGMTELFGHGQDIADTLGVSPERTDSIKHITGFAVRTWDFGYLARGIAVPETQFRFELTAPSGPVWEFGPADADQRITGPAVDFCLLVTRRRHRADLALTASGAQADHWLDIAQAYRGAPGSGRTAGQFAAGRFAAGQPGAEQFAA